LDRRLRIAAHLHQPKPGHLQRTRIVPREHIGEFRLMKPDQAALFWSEVLETTKRLVRDFKMESVAFEISYGNWIVHRKDCHHYHAHVHVLSSNIVQVLQGLKDGGLLNCGVNSRDKVVDTADISVKLPFAPNLETNKWSKFPLFTCINDWFGSLAGFVLRIELSKIQPSVPKEEDPTQKGNNTNTANFSYEYFIRTGGKDTATLQKLVKNPPKGLRV